MDNETYELPRSNNLNNEINRMSSVNDTNVSRIVNQVSETIGISNFIPTFSGENAHEDLIDWFEEYEYTTSALQWTNEERFSKLPLYLKASARKWYTLIRPRVGSGQQIDIYEKLKHEMLKMLIQLDYRTEYHRKMMTMKQKKGESHSYILNMQALFKRVDKDMNESTVLTYIREGLDGSLKP